jgi:phosphoglycerate kinase
MNISKKIIINYKNLKKKETWLYSAGFNVEKNSSNFSRIDEEIYDLKELMKKKCKVFLITHQGDFKKKTSKHLFFLKKILREKLKVDVSYYAGKINRTNMLNLINKKKVQSITIVGNTRLQKGEQSNSKETAKIYSILSSKIIIGGFSKVHRKNASNNAIINFTKSFLSKGIIQELKKIEKWKKFSKKNYMILLGGVKKEKVELGLAIIAKNFKVVVPSGLVLNTILKQLNYKIGQSEYFKDNTLKIVKIFLRKYKSKIILPSKIIVINSFSKKKRTCLLNDVKNNEIIGGFMVSKELKQKLLKCKKDEKILLSGTPSLVDKKIYEPTRTISKYLRTMSKNLLILGGDSANDLNFTKNSNISSGGGAALSYLALNRLEVIDKIRGRAI